jgi:hypothetical protein
MFYKTRLLVLLLFGLGMGCKLYSQHLSHQVLASAAGVKKHNEYNFSQTVGETAVEILTGYDHVVTQGFQQPGFSPSTTIEHQGNGVDVYPNPATENLTIKFWGTTSRDFDIEILTIAGTLNLKDEVSFTGEYYLEKIIKVDHLKSGLYFVRIMSSDKLINRTFKIEKL